MRLALLRQKRKALEELTDGRVIAKIKAEEVRNQRG